MVDETHEVLELEHRRGAAIGSRDLKALADTLADDYLHVLATGATRDKHDYIEMIWASPRRPIRGEMKVRFFGDAAVITGELTNNIGAPGAISRVIPAFCTQVAAKGKDGRWRFVSYILTQHKDAKSKEETMADEIQAVKDLERRRCEAIAKGDMPALAETLAEDYYHIQGGGTTNDKTSYIEEIRRAPRVPERGELKVRIYGNTAVVTGDITNRITYPDRPPLVVYAIVGQVAVKQADGKWRWVNFQLTTKTGKNLPPEAQTPPAAT